MAGKTDSINLSCFVYQRYQYHMIHIIGAKSYNNITSNVYFLEDSNEIMFYNKGIIMNFFFIKIFGYYILKSKFWNLKEILAKILSDDVHFPQEKK